MSAGRLLSLLLLLQSRGRMSAPRIAGELGVSVRSAYRDLARLQAAGVPVYAEPGRGGGYQLLDGYRTRLTGMTEGEARALFFAGPPGPAADLGLAAEVTAARLKLLAAPPTQLREAAWTAAVFHLDAPGWYRGPEPAPRLALFVDALLTGRAVDVRYRRWRAPQEVKRRLRPRQCRRGGGAGCRSTRAPRCHPRPDRYESARLPSPIASRWRGQGHRRQP
ncbi:helix-turn-helix transcriptional regulator [Streptomyces sp. 6N106]|uniref:helix-turn-helix transcriptional regulator n=1 Tax=Streptomyces sp. 6N106 TaxID=3457418 RepID=UPI003FD64E2E